MNTTEYLNTIRLINPNTESVLKLWNDEHFQPQHVLINRYGLVALALDFACRDPKIPDWLSEQEKGRLLPADPEAFLSYILFTSAINFSFVEFRPPFRKFKVADKTGEYFGSQAMCRCFYRQFGENPISAKSIRTIAGSPRLSREFFRGETPIPLFEHRRYFLVETANALINFLGGKPLEIFEMANYKAFGNENKLGVVELLGRLFPKSFGMDYCFHLDDLGQQWPLRFSKRSQLLLMLYQGRALSHGNGMLPLEDGEDLGPIADSALPNALRNCGALHYSPELAQKVDRREVLAPNSAEVREIRMATVAAMEELFRLTNAHRNEIAIALKTKIPAVSILALDNALWQKGRNLKTPAHLSLTTDY